MEPRFPCTWEDDSGRKCLFSFTNPQAMTLHLYTKHWEKKIFRCPVCQLMCRKQQYVNYHICVNLQEKIFFGYLTHMSVKIRFS